MKYDRQSVKIGDVITKPRTKQRAVRREEILDAAQQLFLEKGFAETSIEEITAAADVAKGTLYLYFISKEKLLEALRTRYSSAFCEAIQFVTDKCEPNDWPARLRAWVTAAVDDYLDRYALHAFLFHEAQVSAPQLTASNVSLAQLIALLRGGAAAGVWAIDDVEVTAVMLFHAMHGAIDEAAAHEHVRRKKLITSIVTFFERAVAVHVS